MTRAISVCNWDDFQHYRDRAPPWIKLYREILTSESWLLGTDLSRLLQVAITLLAARYKNAIPYKLDLIKKATHVDADEQSIRVALDHLSEHKFIEISGFELVEQTASMALAKCSSESESESEKSQRRKDMSNGASDHVVLVFQHWQREWGKGRSALDPKRRALIAKALKAYKTEDLLTCITGYRNSDFHRGQNDRNTVYDDIGLFLRDSSKIDQGIKFAEAPVAIQQRSVTTADLLARGHKDELE